MNDLSARSVSASGDDVAELVARARAAQRSPTTTTRQRVDELVAAAGWAIIEPARNRELAELAVRRHRHRQRRRQDPQEPSQDLRPAARPAGRAQSVGVICGRPGARHRSRSRGRSAWSAAITPSTNPAATPANKIINALKGRNAVIVAPSPKGWSTCARLIEFIHQQFDRIGAPRDLVQMLPAPVTKDSTVELMRQADLVVATGSQANVRAAYASGTPAFGVGAGNVAAIVDETADLDAAAEMIVRSKTFDNATSCSSENSVVVIDAIYERCT